MKAKLMICIKNNVMTYNVTLLQELYNQINYPALYVALPFLFIFIYFHFYCLFFTLVYTFQIPIQIKINTINKINKKWQSNKVCRYR